MARRATWSSMGLQDNCEDPHRGNSLKLAYGSEAVIPTEVHVAKNRLMKYQDEKNEE